MHSSEWSVDDTLGAINELSPQGVVEAAKLACIATAEFEVLLYAHSLYA
jgi:hypothetical protein